MRGWQQWEGTLEKLYEVFALRVGGTFSRETPSSPWLGVQNAGASGSREKSHLKDARGDGGGAEIAQGRTSA